MGHEYIIRLASKGVFKGYEDGTFKPQQQITRIESIVAAVRLMGLRDQAESAAEMGTKLNFKDADVLAVNTLGRLAMWLLRWRRTCSTRRTHGSAR